MPKLTKVNQIGFMYFHQFKYPDGSTVREKTTAEDYAQLARKNPSNPTKSGARWELSFEHLKFDTPDGFLPDNSYAEGIVARSGKLYKVGKLPGFKMKTMKNEDIAVDGTVVNLKRLESLPL